jgi:hypothetical protein
MLCWFGGVGGLEGSFARPAAAVLNLDRLLGKLGLELDRRTRLFDRSVWWNIQVAKGWGL